MQSLSLQNHIFKETTCIFCLYNVICEQMKGITTDRVHVCASVATITSNHNKHDNFIKICQKKRLSYEYIYRNALSTCTEHAAHPGVFLSALPSFNVSNRNYYYSSYTLSDPDNPSKLSHLDKVFVLGSN